MKTYNLFRLCGSCCLFMLSALLLTACHDEDTREQPIFLTNVEINDANKTFNPGETVTILADGIQPNDNISLDSYWSIDDPLLSEGSMRGQTGIITGSTATSITFLAPGHLPASRTEIYLNRGSERQLLGEISVANGQSPDKLQLYGINKADSPNSTGNVEHIDLSTGRGTQVVSLSEGQTFSCPINQPGSNILYGMMEQNNVRTLYCYDLSMHYWGKDANAPSPITLAGGSNLYDIYQESDDLLLITDLPSTIYTRSYTPPYAKLPTGLKPDALKHGSGVCVQDEIFLSANNGDGTFSPVIISPASNGEYSFSIQLCDPLTCDALIPFLVLNTAGEGAHQYAVGYAVSAANGGETEFRLWDSNTMQMKAPFATCSAPILSVASNYMDGRTSQKLYVLTQETDNSKQIKTYDLTGLGEWQTLTSDCTYTDIVLAR